MKKCCGITIPLAAMNRLIRRFRKHSCTHNHSLDKVCRLLAHGLLLCAVLDKASSSCVRIYNDAKNRHVSARLDLQVRPDDGLVEACNEFVSAVNELHDTIEDLSDWISTNDAVLQPTKVRLLKLSILFLIRCFLRSESADQDRTLCLLRAFSSRASETPA